MVKNIEIDEYRCVCTLCNSSAEIVYMIYPQVAAFDTNWLIQQASKHAVNICVIYIPSNRWNNDLTPWPEPPESEGFDPFGGEADKFRLTLVNKILPKVDDACELKKVAHRNLIGVSLSGLFTLWQWMQYDTFDSVASLSGSFWYAGFLQWFDSISIPDDKGKAYFLLGLQEPKAKIKAYQSVGKNTEDIVIRLKAAGIDCHFDWVPGNHFSNPIQRAEMALEFLYPSVKS